MVKLGTHVVQHNTELSGIYRTVGPVGAKSWCVIHCRRPSRIGISINVETHGSAELVGRRAPNRNPWRRLGHMASIETGLVHLAEVILRTCPNSRFRKTGIRPHHCWPIHDPILVCFWRGNITRICGIFIQNAQDPGGPGSSTIVDLGKVEFPGKRCCNACIKLVNLGLIGWLYLVGPTWYVGLGWDGVWPGTWPGVGCGCVGMWACGDVGMWGCGRGWGGMWPG